MIIRASVFNSLLWILCYGYLKDKEITVFYNVPDDFSFEMKYI